MLSKLFGYFSKDIGIDLGTANTLIYVRGRGIVINEPSVVAINQKTGQVLAIGDEARRMVGRTPAHIIATRPLRKGVISDFEVTEQMLKYFIQKVHRGSFFLLPRPRVVIGIPCGVTEVEKKAVEDAAKNAGAREVYLIEEPIAAAIGAHLPVQDAVGSMIIDIGGGTTEIAVISLGGLVCARSVRVAGDKMNEDIIDFVREEYNLLLGERTAEEIKIEIGSCLPLEQMLEGTLRGRDLVSGLPKEITVSDKEIRKALENSVRFLTVAVKETIEATPPELLADIMRNGIILAGGGGLLRKFSDLLTIETKITVKLAEDPLTAVVRGTGVILENIEKLKDTLVSNDSR